MERKSNTDTDDVDHGRYRCGGGQIFTLTVLTTVF